MEQEKELEPVVGLASNNPLLANITDYLIEEASAEEEELLGRREGEEEEGGEEGQGVQRDEELIGVLDRMVLYLRCEGTTSPDTLLSLSLLLLLLLLLPRIVHSVDFYNHSEYPNEDEMPNRCVVQSVRDS